jgi:hypothetical protein
MRFAVGGVADQSLGGGGLATDRRGTPEEAEDAPAGGQGE